VKWDGYRAVAEIRDGKVSLYSRSLIALDKKFSPVAASLRTFRFDAVLDGESLSWMTRDVPIFRGCSITRIPEAVICSTTFLISCTSGHDLTGLPLIRRKELLKKILPSTPSIRFSDHVWQEGVLFYQATKEKGLEGIIAKHSQSLYEPGKRSRQWLKVKTRLTQEAVIAGFTEPGGGRKYFGALLLGVYEGDQLIYIGHVGSGFTEGHLKDIREKLEPLIQEECPLTSKPETNAPAPGLTRSWSARSSYPAGPKMDYEASGFPAAARR